MVIPQIDTAQTFYRQVTIIVFVVLFVKILWSDPQFQHTNIQLSLRPLNFKSRYKYIGTFVTDFLHTKTN